MHLGTRDKVVHVLFRVGVIAKAVDGVLELVGGVALLLVSPGQLGGIVRALTQHELSQDPTDMVASLIVRSAQQLSAETRLFAAIFLLWHGAVKLGLVLGLLRNKLWAYPTAIAAFGAFVAYQVYRYTHTRSAWLLVLTVIDLFVIVLAWLEYQRLRREAGDARGGRGR